MTKTRRIILNVLSTYGRSIVSFVVTLFTARWILMALGEEDFGAYGVVGCLTFIVNLFNNAQASAVARYYAYYIGKTDIEGTSQSGRGLDSELQRWFNAALSIHLAIPIVFISAGLPIGEYAIRHWLNFPLERLQVYLWCYRLSLVTLFFSMVSVPYVAMYTAYQYITQLVCFSFIQVFSIFGISYYLLFCRGNRLLVYAVLMMVAHVLVELLKVYFARRQFKSCRVSLRQMWEAAKIKALLHFAFYKMLGNVGFGVRSHGIAFFVNIAYGTTVNAACNVAHQLAAQSVSFCSTLANSFAPAIVTEEGAGQRRKMIDMSFMCCRFGGLLVLTFAIPLIIEMDNWLHIWLVNPPEATASICVYMVITFVLDYLTAGHHIAIAAVGDVARWQLFDTVSYMMSIPIAVVLYIIGIGPVAVGYAYVFAMVLAVVNRLYYARKVTGMGVRRWFRSVLLPQVMVAAMALSAGYFVRYLFPQNLLRIIITGGVSAFVLWSTAWCVVLEVTERDYVVAKIKHVWRKRPCRG